MENIWTGNQLEKEILIMVQKIIMIETDNIKVLYAKLKKGYLRFKTKDFSPKDEFRLREIRNLNLEDYFPEKTEKGFRYTDDLMQAAYNARLLKEDELKKISDADLNI